MCQRQGSFWAQRLGALQRELPQIGRHGIPQHRLENGQSSTCFLLRRGSLSADLIAAPDGGDLPLQGLRRLRALKASEVGAVQLREQFADPSVLEQQGAAVDFRGVRRHDNVYLLLEQTAEDFLLPHFGKRIFVISRPSPSPSPSPGFLQQAHQRPCDRVVDHGQRADAAGLLVGFAQDAHAVVHLGRVHEVQHLREGAHHPQTVCGRDATRTANHARQSIAVALRSSHCVLA
mmetsp:Transcript_26249/g.43774  ORF Transcript_26249/g.43774 Transcript_26249/m.43774 type:complete len:233 (-) Transcript_26249:532-1230(-)